MLMATFQASLKTLANTAGSLTELVGRMNTYACTNSQNGRRFTTAFLAEYDPASRNLTYVNAGHNAPILRRQTGAIERLQTGGIPLGIQENVPYESGTVTLQSGDWLVIFTDGVIEAENIRSEEYGEARLLTMLHANVAVTPAMLLNTIMLDLDRFVGNAPQHDDVTLHAVAGKLARAAIIRLPSRTAHSPLQYSGSNPQENCVAAADMWVVIGQPHLAVSVFPEQRLQRKIDRHRGSSQHQRSSALRTAKDKQLCRPHRESNLRGLAAVVYAREDGNAAFLSSASRRCMVSSTECLLAR